MTVSGPEGFSQAVSTSTVLTDVAPGAYSAVASSVTDGNNTYTATVLGSPVEVSSSSGAGIEVSYALDLGSLEVTIIGLPGGVDADVLVAGANGFSQLVASSTTLTDLTPGLYSLSAEAVRTDDPIVSEIYNLVAPLATIEVTSGATASVSAMYLLRPGSGTLWLAQTFGANNVVGFSAEHLATSTSSTPEVTLTTAATNEEGVVVDGDGDLWVIDQFEQAVEYDVSDLGVDGSPSAKVTITGLPENPVWGAFDSSGSLWIASATGDTVVEFRADQLLVDGAPTPNVTITGLNTPLQRVCSLSDRASCRGMAHSTDLRERIINAVIHKRYTLQKAADTFDVGAATVSRYLRRYRQGGDLTPQTSPGRPSALVDHQAWVEQSLIGNDLTHDQRCDLLFDEIGVRISRATMCRWVQRLGSTRKKDDLRR